MNAFLEACRFYHGNELKNIMAYCARYGAVYADGDCFVCGYRTHSSFFSSDGSLVGIKSKKTVDTPDTWLVMIATGKVERAFDVVEPLEYLAYERFDGTYRLVEWRRIWAVFDRKSNHRHRFPRRSARRTWRARRN